MRTPLHFLCLVFLASFQLSSTGWAAHAANIEETSTPPVDCSAFESFLSSGAFTLSYTASLGSECVTIATQLDFGPDYTIEEVAEDGAVLDSYTYQITDFEGQCALASAAGTCGVQLLEFNSDNSALTLTADEGEATLTPVQQNTDNWGIWQSYIILDAGSGNNYLAGGLNPDNIHPAFAGSDLGTITLGSTFTLNGGEIKTYKNSGANVCGGNINYRVYSNGGTPGSFNAIALGFDSDLGNGDQKWAKADAGVDLLAGLSAGDYTLEIFWDASGDTFSGCSSTNYESNSGANYTASFSLIEIVNGCTDPNYAEYDATANTDDGSCNTPLSVTNENTSAKYATIQEAIDDASAGDVISLASGTLSPGGQITINKALSLTGAGSASTTINGGGSGYAIAVTADNVHLEGFTLNGAGSYGIKVSNSTTSIVQDFSMTDVATDGTTHTGIDLNGVDGATLTNIAGHNTVSGFGLAIASSANVTVNGLTTSGNAWGDAAVFPAGTSYQLAGYEAPTGIVFDGTLDLSSGAGALSIQDGALASGGSWTASISNDAADNADITVPANFDGCVNATRNDGLSFHTVSPGAAGEGITNSLTAASTPFTYSAITFQNLTSGEWAVFGDLLIQDAIDAASAGDAIELEGTFSPSATISVNKSLTVYGQGSASTTINGGGSGYGMSISADNVHLQGFTLDGAATFGVKASGVSNFSLQDVAAINGNNSAIDLNGVNGATLTDISASNTALGYGLAISSSSDVTVDGITTSSNAYGAVGIFPAETQYQSSGLEAPSNITIGGSVSLNGGAGAVTVQNGALASGGTWVGTVSNDAADNADVTVPAGFTHAVFSTRNDGLTGQSVASQAVIAGLVAYGAANPIPGVTYEDVYIYDMVNGDYEVIEPLLIQDAIDAASASDVINIAAGTYEEDLALNKGVTLNGPNAGIAHDSGRSAEAILVGENTLSAIDAATIDGVQFLNDDAGAVTSSLTIASAAGHLVQNNLFVSSVAGGNTGGTHDKGIYINSLTSGSVTITENGFSGDGSFTDGDRYSTAPWGRGIWMNGGGASITISDNAFTNCRTGINLEAHDNTAHTISSNTFTDCGSGMSLGNPTTGEAITSITGNRFQDVDTDINARNLTQDLEWNLASTDNLAIAGNSTYYSDLGYIPGNSAGDIDDPNGNLAFLSGNGADRLTFGADDNTITGDYTGAGNDYLNGGDGTDRANYPDNEADVTLTAADDCIIITSPTAGTDTLLNIEYLVLADATLSLIGCTFPDACNYNEMALTDDGSCEFSSCTGCRDEDACNYDATATLDGPSGTCSYPGLYEDCNGDCLNDANTNGICDELEAIGVEGCTDASATNYNPAATDDDGSCYTYTLEGCLIPSATNYDPTVNVQGEPISAFCIFPWNSAFVLPSTDCADSFACNYDATATGYSECDYCLGCTDAGACNYDDTAFYDDGSCSYTGCSGCTSDCSSNYEATAVIDDGSCDYANCGGCTDPDADNYNAAVSIDDGSCQYEGCTLPSACNFDPDANANDGSCSLDPAPVISAVELVLSTTSLSAADGEVSVTVDSGTPVSLDLEGLNGTTDASFSYPGTYNGLAAGYYAATVTDGFGCVSNSVNVVVSYDLCCDCGVSDQDSDGLCDDADNCFDRNATNFADPANGNCIIPGCTDPAYLEYDASATNDDGSCSTLIIEGCTDGAADNFNSAANTDDGSCIYYGCTNPAYTEYDATANTDDGSCSTLIVEGCTDGAADNYNSAANTDDGSCIYYGCTDPAYMEYDATANADDGSCQCLIVDPACVSPTMDGYSYDVVRIGCQCWFAENLRTTVYADGTVIPAGLTDSEWLAATSGATAVYGQGTSTCNNYSPDIDACGDPAQSLAEWGRLYNWYAATDAAGLCPSGWHVPSDEEWQVLEVELGMFPASANTIGWRETDEGQKLKSTSGWWEYPVGGYNNGTDDFGFAGLPAGYRSTVLGNSSSAGASAFFWSTTLTSGESAYDLGDRAFGRGLSRNQPRIRRYEYKQKSGFSVRCIKD